MMLSGTSKNSAGAKILSALLSVRLSLLVLVVLFVTACSGMVSGSHSGPAPYVFPGADSLTSNGDGTYTLRWIAAPTSGAKYSIFLKEGTDTDPTAASQAFDFTRPWRQTTNTLIVTDDLTTKHNTCFAVRFVYDKFDDTNTKQVCSNHKRFVIPTFAGCIAATALDNRRVKVDFEFPSDAEKVIIKRAGTSVFSTTDSSVTTFSDTDLGEGSTYNYTCHAVFRGIEADGTQSVQATTVSINAPTFPGVVAAEPNSTTGGISVQWGLPTSGVAVDTVKIYATLINPAAQNPVMSWSTPFKTVAALGSTSTTLTAELGDQLSYLIGVRGCSASGSCDSNTKTLMATVPNRGAPLTVGAASVSVNNRVATLIAPWNHTQGAISKRKVYGKIGSGAFSLMQYFTVSEPWSPPTSLTLSDVVLLEGSTYTFYVLDEDSLGNLSNTSAAQVQLAVSDLTAPTFVGLTDASVTTESSVSLTFTAIASQPSDTNGANEYLVYKALAPTGSSVSACSTGTVDHILTASNYTAGNSVTTSVTGLSSRTRYSFCVKARDEALNVSSTEAQITLTTTDQTAPLFGGITSLTYNNADRKVVVGWNASPSSDVYQYKVSLWRGLLAVPTNLATVTVLASTYPTGYSVSSSEFAVSDLETIYAKVDACDNASVTTPQYASSNNCTSTLYTSGASLLVPDVSPPPGFAGINTATQTVEGTVTVSWFAPANWTGYRGFKVYTVSSGGALSSDPIATCACAANNCAENPTSCSLTVGARETLRFHVRAYDVSGNETTYAPMDSPSTNQVSILTLDTTVPSFTANLVKGAAPTFTFSWSAATDNQVEGTLSYHFYRKKGSNFSDLNNPAAELGSADVKRVIKTTTSHTETDTLVEGVTYYYTVCAVDASNNMRCGGSSITHTQPDTTPPTISSFSTTKTPSSTTWSLVFTVGDNKTAKGALDIKIFRSTSVTASDPALTSDNLLVDYTGSALSCDPGPCTYTGETGNAGVTEYINYRIVVTDELLNSVTSSTVSVLWDDRPLSVTGVTRTGGALTGGKLIFISGTNFASGATVKLGTLTCGSVVVESSTALSCVTPDASATYAAGTSVAVVVTNTDGRSNAVQSVLYQFGNTGNICDTPASWGASFAGGDGSSGTPYLVCTATHLDNIRNNVATINVFEIRDHIDLYTFGTWTGIPNFQGTVQGLLDGNNIPQFSIRKMTTATGFVERSLSSNNTDTFSNLRFSQPLVESNIASQSLGVVMAHYQHHLNLSRVHVFEPVVRKTVANATSNGGLGGIVGSGATGKPITITNSVVTNAIIEVPSTSTTGSLGGLVGYVVSTNPTTISSNDVSATISTNNAPIPVGGAVGSTAFNLTLSNNVVRITISTAASAGGLIVGAPGGAAIFSSNTVSGSIKGGDYVGGLAGATAFGAIDSRNSFSGTVEGRDYVGGFFGHMGVSGPVTQLHTDATVKGRNYVGGLVGYCKMGANNTTHSQFSASGTVTATGQFVGGLAGVLTKENAVARLSDSFASGDVTGVSYVGGLVGFLGTPGTTATGWDAINRVGATGTVTATGTGASVGGLIGGYYSDFVGATLTNSFWDTATTGQSASGFPSGATGVNTATMKTQSTFTSGAGWDFMTVWLMNPTTGYPALRFIFP